MIFVYLFIIGLLAVCTILDIRQVEANKKYKKQESMRIDSTKKATDSINQSLYKEKQANRQLLKQHMDDMIKIDSLEKIVKYQKHILKYHWI